MKRSRAADPDTAVGRLTRLGQRTAHRQRGGCVARPDDRGDLPGPVPADPLAGIGADPRQQLVEVGSRRNGEDGQHAIAVSAGQAAQALSAYRGPGVLQDRMTDVPEGLVIGDHRPPRAARAGFVAWPRRPEAFAWKPRQVRRVSDSASRMTSAGSALLRAAFLALYLAPGPITGALTLGRVDAKTLSYSDSFHGELRMPWLVALVLAIIVLHILVAVQGRWRGATRWARIFLHRSAAVQLGRHARYGNIFQHAHTDRVLVPAVATLAGILMAVAWIELYRELTRARPGPAPA